MPEEKHSSPVVPFIITVVLVGVFIAMGMGLSGYATLPDIMSAFQPSPWRDLHDRYHDLSRQAEYKEALSVIRSALAYAKDNEGEMSRRTCISLTDLTECLTNLGRYEEAITTGKEALNIAEIVYAESKYMIVRCLQAIGENYYYLEDYKTAESWFVQARETLNTYEAGADDETELLDWLAAAHERQERWDESIPLYEQMLQLYADSTRFVDDIIRARENMAEAYGKMGKLEASEDAFTGALATAESYYGKESPKHGEILLVMAAFHTDTDRYSSAEDLYRRSIEILNKIPDPTVTPSAGEAMEQLADHYTDLDLNEKTLGTYREMLAWYEESFGEAHKRTAYPHYKLGAELETAGRTEEALSHFRRAVDIFDSAPDAADAEKIYAYITLAEALERSSDMEQAAIYRNKADALKAK